MSFHSRNTSFNRPVLQLLQGGQEFFPALIAAIDQAQRRISFETYIFDFYGAGTQVAQALALAAQRGVKVQLLVDGVGTDGLDPAWFEKWTQAGVQCSIYSPMVGFWRGLGWMQPKNWRRLHRKLCVVDEQLLFCGGINVLDDFYDPHHGVLDQPRLDFSVAVTGEVVAHAQAAMDVLWWRVQARRSLQHRQLAQTWKATRAVFQHKPRIKKATNLLLRDNLLHRHSIERAYRKAIGQARQEVVIANAYFLPGGKLRRALMAAARRGVSVQLLLQGKYEHFMQYHGARAVYAPLLKAGVQIYEYTNGFLHAKVAVIDGRWATVGSSNLDPLSFLLAREANVVIEDSTFAQELRSRLQQAMNLHGQRLEPSDYARRPWSQRLLDRLAYAAMRLGVWVTGHSY